MKPLFVTGIGTDTGKTLISVIIARALSGDYWKPVQAGREPETDSDYARRMLAETGSIVFPEVYILNFPASPHLAARKENLIISLNKITNQLPSTHSPLVIEGAGGIMVPLNEEEFVIDLIEKLDASVILVSRNYLGSINHSLLTASACKQRKLDVKGWIFSGDYGGYASDISRWTGYPIIGEIPELPVISPQVVHQQSKLLQNSLKQFISDGNR